MSEKPGTSTNLGVAAGTPQIYTTQVAFTQVLSMSVLGTYSTLPGSQPKAYQDFVAVWPNSQIPWTAASLGVGNVTQNLESGSFSVSNLQITSTTYIIGYGVGVPSTPNWPAVCASAIITPGGLPGAADYVSMSIGSISTSLIAVNYHTLAGYLPAAANNWIGLWQGQASPYYAPAPMSAVSVPNPNQGSVIIPSIIISPNTTYTLIYFMGGPLISSTVTSNTLAACILQFQTGSTVGGADVMMLSAEATPPLFSFYPKGA